MVQHRCCSTRVHAVGFTTVWFLRGCLFGFPMWQMSHKTRHFKPDPLHYCHFAPIFLKLLNPLHVHAIASMWKMSHNRQMFKTLQQTNPQHFCHLCCGINTVLQVSRRSRPVSFFATFTNSQITQMSRKSRPATFLLLLPVLKFYHPTTDRDWTQPRRQYQILIRSCIWSEITTNTHPAMELQSFEPQSIIEQIWHCLEKRSSLLKLLWVLLSIWIKELRDTFKWKWY